MKIEDLEFRRLYEITYVPEDSAWRGNNLVGNIVERIRTDDGTVRISQMKSYESSGYVRRHMYIHGATYRPLSLKDAAKIRKELSNAK